MQQRSRSWNRTGDVTVTVRTRIRQRCTCFGSFTRVRKCTCTCTAKHLTMGLKVKKRMCKVIQLTKNQMKLNELIFVKSWELKYPHTPVRIIANCWATDGRLEHFNIIAQP